MTTHEMSDGRARAKLREQVTAAAEVAAQDWRHPGHWTLHAIVLADGPGDFTRHRPPDYVEQEFFPGAGLLERLAELLGPDHARIIADRGIEAGHQAEAQAEPDAGR